MKYGPTPLFRRVKGSNQYSAKYVRLGRYATPSDYARIRRTRVKTRRKKLTANQNMVRWLTIYGIFIGVMFLGKIGVEYVGTQVHAQIQKFEAQAKRVEIISPVPDEPKREEKKEKVNVVVAKAEAKEKENKPKPSVKADNYDIWVGEAVNLFFGDDKGKKSEVRMIMHCLLFHESRHSDNVGHGDNGMAGGPLQFWEETWLRMRGRMVNEGYADNMSDRYNMKDAIYTTVYAIYKGWAKEWGPILRDYNGAGWNTCPTPSWYE